MKRKLFLSLALLAAMWSMRELSVMAAPRRKMHLPRMQFNTAQHRHSSRPGRNLRCSKAILWRRAGITPSA